MKILMITIVCVLAMIMAIISLLVDKRKVFKYSYVQPKSFMEMYNGDINPCDYHEKLIECGNYIYDLKFVIEDNWYDRH